MKLDGEPPRPPSPPTPTPPEPTPPLPPSIPPEDDVYSRYYRIKNQNQRVYYAAGLLRKPPTQTPPSTNLDEILKLVTRSDQNLYFYNHIVGLAHSIKNQRV